MLLTKHFRVDFLRKMFLTHTEYRYQNQETIIDTTLLSTLRDDFLTVLSTAHFLLVHEYLCVQRNKRGALSSELDLEKFPKESIMDFTPPKYQSKRSLMRWHSAFSKETHSTLPPGNFIS